MANAEQAERANRGSFKCVQCENEFTSDNPCCCDFAIYEDGSHCDGVCRNCCAPNHIGQRDFVNHRGE